MCIHHLARCGISGAWRMTAKEIDRNEFLSHQNNSIRDFWATKTITIKSGRTLLHKCIIYSMPFDFRRSVTGWNEFACTKVAPLPTQRHNMSTPWGQISRNHVHQYVDDVGSSTSQLAMQCFMWDLLPSCCMVCDPVAAIEISENQCF